MSETRPSQGEELSELKAALARVEREEAALREQHARELEERETGRDGERRGETGRDGETAGDSWRSAMLLPRCCREAQRSTHGEAGGAARRVDTTRMRTTF